MKVNRSFATEATEATEDIILSLMLSVFSVANIDIGKHR
jgi:hypothetical protein